MCLFRLVRGLFCGLVVGCLLCRSVGIVVVGVFVLVCGVVSIVGFCSMGHSMACGVGVGCCVWFLFVWCVVSVVALWLCC